MENDSTEIADCLNSYSRNVEMMRIDLMRMVYDTFIDYENIDKSNFRYSTLNEYYQGFENDKWYKHIDEFLHEFNNDENKQSRFLEIKQNEYLSLDQIPKKPERKINQFNFKGDGIRIISFSEVSNIKIEKLGQNKLAEIYKNKNINNVIQVIDKNNNIVVLNKFFVDFDKEEPELFGNIDHYNLQKRADILVSSRFQILSKLSLTIGKFIVSLKKIHNKIKEKRRNRSQNSTIRNTGILKNLFDGKNSILNSNNSNNKLIKRKIILSSTPFTNTDEKSKADFELDMKKFKKLFDKTVKEKTIKRNIEKKEKLKNKLNNFFMGNDDLFRFNRDSNEDDIDDLYEEDLGKKILSHSIIQTNREIMEDKIVIQPKMKVNTSGLKMFIKEDLNRLKKSS